MPPYFGPKPVSQRKERFQNGTTVQRKPEKNHFKAWEVTDTEEDMGIVSWMKFDEKSERQHSEDSEIAQIRRKYCSKCPSLENVNLFERESLHDRFLKKGQFSKCDPNETAIPTSNDTNIQNSQGSKREVPAPQKEANSTPPKDRVPPPDKLPEQRALNEPEAKPQISETIAVETETITSRTGSRSPLKETETKPQISGSKRAVKSANSLYETNIASTEKKENVLADDNTSLPPRSLTSTDQFQDMTSVEAERKKVQKLLGLAQKYTNRSEGVDCGVGNYTDEGYDSKISSNNTEETEDSKPSDDLLTSGDKYLSYPSDVNSSNSGNSFHWVRDPGLSPGRIIKLSYCQKEKSFSSVNSEKFDSLYRTLSRHNTGNNFKGIMAASLSNLSPSSLNIRHFREAGNLSLLNFGGREPAKWGYENNSRGHFFQSKEHVKGDDVKPTAMVLRKVTIQDAHEDRPSGCENVPPEATERPESTRDDSVLARERSVVQASRTSPQLSVDSMKVSRNVSIPSPQQYRHTYSRGNPRIPRLFEGKDYMFFDSAPAAHIPLGELLPAVEKSIVKNQTQRTLKVSSQNDRLQPKNGDPYCVLSDEDRAMILRREMDAVAASYDQDGSETVRVSSPQFQPRRRIGSATRYLGRVVSGPFRGTY